MTDLSMMHGIYWKASTIYYYFCTCIIFIQLCSGLIPKFQMNSERWQKIEKRTVLDGKGGDRVVKDISIDLTTRVTIKSGRYSLLAVLRRNKQNKFVDIGSSGPLAFSLGLLRKDLYSANYLRIIGVSELEWMIEIETWRRDVVPTTMKLFLFNIIITFGRCGCFVTNRSQLTRILELNVPNSWKNNHDNDNVSSVFIIFITLTMFTFKSDGISP